MSTLEIIHLRSSVEPIDTLIESIKESIWDAGHNGKVVTMYRRYGVATDVAIHISRDVASSEKHSSPLAVRLASALKDFGLVEHSVWEKVGNGGETVRSGEIDKRKKVSR